MCRAGFGPNSLCLNNTCVPALRDLTRGDGAFPGGFLLAGVSTAGPRFGSVSFLAGESGEPGVNYYGGTLVIDVPEDASGSYTIGFDGSQRNTFMVDDAHLPIPIASLVPAVITIAPKNRYLTLSPAAMAAVSGKRELAIRVTLLDLDGFGDRNGEVRWVGEPSVNPDEGAGTFLSAPLQCDPHFHTWDSFDPVEIYGDAIIPDSKYAVQIILSDCPTTDEACYGDATIMATAQWADVAAAFSIDSTASAQPDFIDIAMMVAKFAADPSAPGKDRMQLQPAIVRPGSAIDFGDIAVTVDAFTGGAYPHGEPASCGG